MRLNEKVKKVMNELEDPEIWAPSLSKIARKTGISVATVFDIVHRAKAEGRIGLSLSIEKRTDEQILEEDKNGPRT